MTDFHAEFFLLHLSLMLGFEAGSSSHLSIKHKSIHSTLHDQIVKLLLLTPIYVYFFFPKSLLCSVLSPNFISKHFDVNLEDVLPSGKTVPNMQ